MGKPGSQLQMAWQALIRRVQAHPSPLSGQMAIDLPDLPWRQRAVAVMAHAAHSRGGWWMVGGMAHSGAATRAWWKWRCALAGFLALGREAFNGGAGAGISGERLGVAM